MELYGKGLLGSLVLISGSSTTAIWVGGSNWNKNNPVAKTWLSDNHFSPRDKDQITSFNSNSNQNFFALGCHKFLFGGKNFKKLYTENNLTGSKGTESSSSNTSLPISGLFQDVNEPLLGCSTAYLMKDKQTNKKSYQYELALRQGNKGFDERISVHTDKIVSQLIFYEKNPQDDSSKPPTYKHLFGLYRHINQNQVTQGQKTYKVANPNPNPNDSFVEKWSELDLSNVEETQARYYSVWVDDTYGEGIFDNLGVRSKNKPFSSVAKDKNNLDSGASDFVYTNSMDTSKDELKAPEGSPVHYDLSVLDSLVNSIHSRKGFWKPSKEFCSDEISEGGRRPLLEVKRFSQYCYEIKSKPTDPKKSSGSR